MDIPSLLSYIGLGNAVDAGSGLREVGSGLSGYYGSGIRLEFAQRLVGSMEVQNCVVDFANMAFRT